MKYCHDVAEVEHHLQELSSRTRALRARRRITRKELARESGISERYLAQIEAGHANPSLSLLWQLARALDVHFQDLLGVYDRPGNMSDPLAELVQELPPTERQAAYELLMLRFGIGNTRPARQSMRP